MRLLTIQSKKVLNILRSNKTYMADFYHMNHLQLHNVEAYQLLMDYLQYKYVPIFCVVFNRLASFKNAHVIKGSVILDLNVPNEFIKLQSVYAWNDLQSTLFYVCLNDQNRYRKISESLNPDWTDNKLFTIQAILPYIEPDWVTCAYKYDKDFVKTFNDGVLLNDWVTNDLEVL